MPKRGKKVKGTRKEEKALRLLKEGYSVSQVADQVRIGPSTVYTIMKRQRELAQEQAEDKEKVRVLWDKHKERHPEPIPDMSDNGRLLT